MSLEEHIATIQNEKKLTVTINNKDIELQIHNFLGQGGEKAHFHAETPFGRHMRLTIYVPRKDDTIEKLRKRVEAEKEQRNKIASNPFFEGRQAIVGIEQIIEQNFSGTQTVITTSPFVPGQNLTSLDEETRKKYRFKFCQDLISQLAAMHSAGAIHRDIKPDNIIIVPPTKKEQEKGKTKPTAMLIDWSGIRYEGEHYGDSAIGARIMGAPEQQANPTVATKRTDVFQLAQTMYWLLVGKYPFDNEEDNKELSFNEKRQATINNIFAGKYNKKALNRAEVKTLYQKIITKGLEGTAEERTKDAEEMFEHFVKRRRILTAAATVCTIAVTMGVSGMLMDYIVRGHYDQKVQRIATVEKQGDQYDIFSYTHDGKQRTQLTSTSVKESSAQWLEDTLFFQINENIYTLNTNDRIKKIKTRRAVHSFSVCPKQQMLIAKMYDVLSLQDPWEIERYRLAYIEGSRGDCMLDNNTFIHADSPIIWDTNARNVYFRGETNGDLGLVQWDAERKLGKILIENPQEQTSIPVMASNKNLWYEREDKTYRINIETGHVTTLIHDSPMRPMRGTNCTMHSEHEQQVITYVSKSDSGMFLEQIVEDKDGSIEILEKRRRELVSYYGHCIGPNNNIILAGALEGQDANGDGRTTHKDTRLQNTTTGNILSDKPVWSLSLSLEKIRKQVGEMYR